MARKKQELIDDTPVLESKLEDVSDIDSSIKKELPSIEIIGKEVEDVKIDKTVELIDNNSISINPVKKIKDKHLNVPKDYSDEIRKKFKGK